MDIYFLMIFEYNFTAVQCSAFYVCSVTTDTITTRAVT